MRVIVNDKMKEWVAAYIRQHRAEGCISLHVVFSKFNEDFKVTFGIDPVSIVNLMIAEGFLKGMPSHKGFSIWLPEDSGKGRGRPYRSHQKQSNVVSIAAVKKIETPANPAQTGDVKMKMLEAKVEPYYEFEFLPNPETGEVGILALINFIMRKLGEKMPSKPVMDGSYVVVKMDLFPSLSDMGLPREKFDNLSRILQEMGLIRKYPKSQWAILHPKAYEYFVTPTLYNVAKDAMKWRDQRNSEIAKLRHKLAKMTMSPTPEPEVASTTPQLTFEEEAMQALLEAERLAENLAASVEKQKQVENELATTLAKLAEVEVDRDKLALELKNRPGDLELAKQAFSDRLSALKKLQTA